MELLMRKKWYHLDFRAKKGPQQEYRETEEKCLKDLNYLRRILHWDAKDPEIISKGPLAFLIQGFYQKPSDSCLSDEMTMKVEPTASKGQDYVDAKSQSDVFIGKTESSFLAVPGDQKFAVTVQSSDASSPPPGDSKSLCLQAQDHSSLMPQIYVIPATPIRPTDHYLSSGSNPLQAQFMSLLAQQNEREALCARREQDLKRKETEWEAEKKEKVEGFAREVEGVSRRILDLESELDRARKESAKWKSEAKRLREARDTAVEDANVVRVDRTRWRNKAQRLESHIQETTHPNKQNAERDRAN